MIRHSFSLIVILSLFSAYGTAQRADTASDTAAIRSVLAAQQEAWNKGDIEGYMAGYWKSDSLEFTSGGAIRHGWDKTIAGYKASYSSREKMGELSFSNVRITGLGPEAAMVVGGWNLRRRTDSPGGVFTLIMRKFPDGWKIIHDHTSARSEKKSSN
jgi:ketosteroid isomerase-like protein